MAVYQKKKTALENALDFVGGTASHAVNGVKNMVSGAAQGVSKSFGDFYNSFSKDYDNYKTQTDVQKNQTYQNLSSFVNRAAEAPQKAVDYFNPTKGYNPKTYQMENFWSTPVAKTLTKIQQNPIVETTGKIPLNAIKAGIITAGSSQGPSAIALGSAKTPAERKKIIEQDDAMNQKLYQDWYKDNPELFTRDPKTGKLDINLLNATTAQLKGLGALMSPLGVALGGVVNVPFQFALDKIQGKKPLEHGISKSVAEGMDFAALMGPISEATGWALKPFINKFNPVEIKNINQYINLAKTATTPEAKQQFIGLATKRIAQNLSTRAVKGAVGMGTFGAMLPAQNAEERIHNILSNAIQGAIFEPATGALEMGGSAALEQGLKPLLKFSQSPEGQAGFIKFPGSEHLGPEDYRAEIKRRLDKRAEQLLSPEMAGKQKGPMIAEGRKMAREYLKDKEKFLDKYSVVPDEKTVGDIYTKSVIPDTIAGDALNAIRTIENARDAADYMSPNYSNATEKVRQIAAEFAPEIKNSNDINEVISVLKSKIPFEQGNVEAQKIPTPNEISTQPAEVPTDGNIPPAQPEAPKTATPNNDGLTSDVTQVLANAVTTPLSEQAKKYKSAEESNIHTFLADKLGGEPFTYKQDSGMVSTGIKVGDNKIRYQIFDQSDQILMPKIYIENKGTGLGTEFMDSLKELADSKGKKLVINNVENPKFFDKFPWLKYEKSAYRYDPKSQLTDINNQATENVGVGNTNDPALNNKMLENYRGYGIKEPQTTTETYTPRDVKQQLAELQGMRDDFQSQVDRIDNVIENYDLMKKFSNDLMSKTGLKRLRTELTKNIKNVEKEIVANEGKTAERNVPITDQIPSNDELSMKVLNDMRAAPTTEGMPVPTNQELAMKQLEQMRQREMQPENIAPGIKDSDPATTTVVPTTDWQEIPEGQPIPPGAETQIDLNTDTAYARWSPETIIDHAKNNPDLSPEAGGGGIRSTASEKPLQEPIIPEGERVRGHTTTVQDNEAFRQEVRDKVFSTYKPLIEKEIFDKAKEYVLTNESAAKARLMGSEPSSPEILAIGEALFKKKQYEADIAQEKGDITGMRSLDEEAAQIDNAISERITPAARILHYAKRFASSSPQALVRWAERLHEEANMFQNLSPKRLIQKITGKEDWKISFNEDMRAKILEEQRKIGRMEDGLEKWKAVQNLMREATKDIPPSMFQYIDAYRYQNMLISPKTQLRNIVGNITQAFVTRPLTRGMMGAQDFIFNGLRGKERQAYVKDVGAYYKGMLNSLPNAIESFKQGYRGDVLAADKFEVGQGGLHQFTGHNLPKGLTIAGNLLEGADRFFTTFLSDAEYNVLREHGVGEKEARQQALEVATKFLYRNPLDTKNRSGQGHILRSIDKATNFMIGARAGGPINPVGWFVPFVRVPMSVAKMGIEYSPLGYSTLWGATNKSEQIAKANLGAVLMSMGAMAAFNGMTTWAAPTDPTEKEAFYQTGRKPYAFGLPTPDGRTVWIPFNYLGPFGYSVAFPAALKYRFQDAPEAFTDEAGTKIAKALSDELGMWTQQTFLQGLGGFVKTFQGDVDYNVINNLAFTTGQLIPLNGMLGYVNSIIDPIYRKPHGFVEGVLKNVPGYSQGLEPVTNAIGEPASRLPEQDKAFNAVSNYALPFAIGLSDPAYEQQYQSVQDQRQLRSEANFYDKQAQAEVDNILKGTGAKTGGGAGAATGKEKALEAQKQAVDKLLEAYMGIDNPDYKERVKKSIERMGYNFDDQLQSYMLKDIRATQTGASTASKAILERSNEYKLIQKLVEKDGGSGMLKDYIMEQMDKRKITPDEFVYDQQTDLPADVKITEIQATTEGLSGDELFNKLASYRKISEGTRKALLTNGVIDDLVDAGYIDKDTGASLKLIDWDPKNKKLVVNNSKTKGNKDKFKLSVPKSASYKATPIKFSAPVSIKPLTSKTTSVKAKIKAPPVSKPVGIRIKKISTPSFRAPVSNIGGLGR